MRQDWKEDRRREKEEDVIYGILIMTLLAAIAVLVLVAS